MREIRPTPWQTRVLQIPSEYDLLVGGGRGLGKSWVLALLMLQYLQKAGAAARSLYTRRTLTACLDFMLVLRRVLGAAYGSGLNVNMNQHLFVVPSGGTVQVKELGDFVSLEKHIGQSVGQLLIDQAEQHPTPELIDLMRSNLRTEGDEPPRLILAAHPGSRGDAWIRDRYVAGTTPWTPFLEKLSGRQFVRTAGCFRDNPHLTDDYRRQLEASTALDEQLAAAWMQGDWLAGGRGLFFSGVLDTKNLVTWPEPPCEPEPGSWWHRHLEGMSEWELELGFDFGVAAPAVCYLAARSPGDFGPDGETWYPSGSLILVDEMSTDVPGNLNEGLRWTIDKQADAILTMCRRWHAEPYGTSDPAIHAATGSASGSVAEQFRACGITFRPAPRVGRVDGWEKLRQLMLDAGSPDRPGFFADRRCVYFWKTAPNLSRDPRRVDDLDTRQPDHAVDVARYLVVDEPAHESLEPVFL